MHDRRVGDVEDRPHVKVDEVDDAAPGLPDDPVDDVAESAPEDQPERDRGGVHPRSCAPTRGSDRRSTMRRDEEEAGEALEETERAARVEVQAQATGRHR